MRQQQGGTLLGFILGLIVGLAVALVVAVYVTKVPIPFMNKGPKPQCRARRGRSQEKQGLGPQRPLVRQKPSQTRCTRRAQRSCAGNACGHWGRCQR